jgi:hypothetical protein
MHILMCVILVVILCGFVNGCVVHGAAAASGKAVVAHMLLSADVDAVCGADGTPLHAAAASGKAEVAQALLSAGADPDATASGSGATPLHVAIAEGHLAVAEVGTLLFAGDSQLRVWFTSIRDIAVVCDSAAASGKSATVLGRCML